jgi:acetolactate synthase-1/2/3 large subunit
VSRIKISDYLVRHIAAQGVTHAYELAGGMLAHILDSFAKQTSVSLVSMHHEQGAGFAAEGGARISGIPGVAFATSGPGATNLLTPLGSCYFDSTPAVFITGQVNRHELRGERPVRQLGFQETDIVSMARPVTKATFQVMSPESVPDVLDRAFELAVGGRPGPVLVDIPMDVQRIELDLPEPLRRGRVAPNASLIRASDLDEIQHSLGVAQRPLILVGGGVRGGLAANAFRRAVKRLGVPVVHSLMGVDALGSDDPLRVGLIGSYGNRWANHALAECDFLLVVGSRLDIRQTGTDTDGFARRKIIQIDIDAGEINNRVRGVQPVVAQAVDFCEALASLPIHLQGFASWKVHIAALRERWPDFLELKNLSGFNPNIVLGELGRRSNLASAFSVDVGQHQMWAAQSLPVGAHQRFLTSGGMGSMGFALPAAIGAAFACPSTPVVVVAGDGGFQLNIQELQTIVRNRLPIKMVVLNNHAHGMVRQFQESYFEGRYQSTVFGYDTPDFSRVAVAYGIDAWRVDGSGESDSTLGRLLNDALEQLWRDPLSPSLLEVEIPATANAYPKLAFGRGINEMEPESRPLEMEGT